MNMRKGKQVKAGVGQGRRKKQKDEKQKKIKEE